MSKSKYEISIWEDAYINNQYVEEKIAVIGSDTLNSSCMAKNPQLISNINGTNTFSFKLYYHCQKEDLINLNFISNLDGGNYINPFIPYLTNERKIKVLWNNQWYDFIIKEKKEDSSGKTISYECTDAYINELSKTGFNLVFDDELMNNQGTVEDLANIILDGTEWVYDQNSDKILEESEESVYECDLLSGITATKDNSSLTISLPSNTKVLWFYSQFIKLLNSGESGGVYNFQFAYATSYPVEREINVVDADSYTVSLSWTASSGEFGSIFNLYNGSVLVNTINLNNPSKLYRAKRLINSPKMVYDPTTGKYCYLYKVGNEDVYGYEDTSVDDAVAVVNILTNYKDFSDTAGWILEDPNPEFRLYPDFADIENIDDYTAKSYLKIEHTNGITNYNSGLTYCSIYLPDGLQNGSQYVFRYRARSDNNGKPGDSYVGGIACYIGEYENSNEIRTLSGNSIITFGSETSEGDGWYYSIGTINNSYSRAELYNSRIGFFINPSNTVWIEEIQLFKYVLSEDEINFIRPDQFATTSLVRKRYNYYSPSSNPVGTDKDDLIFLYQGYEEQTYGVQQFTDFERVRSITGSKSNRFNLLQTIAEEFKCWVRFIILHDSYGRVTGKRVLFKREIGQEIPYNFQYGIDLNAIKRTINSNEIVTKTIILANNNEYAKYGSCDVSRSVFNLARNNIIYDFDYYINKGMMNKDDLFNDFYSTALGAIGYYPNLSRTYSLYDSTSEAINKLSIEKLRLNSYLTSYEAAKSSSQEMITSYKANISNLLGKEFDGTSEEISSYLIYYSNPEHQSETALKLLKGLQNIKNKNVQYSTIVAECKTAIETMEAQIVSYENNLRVLEGQIKYIEDSFSRKYSRFIQEGTWQDEQYVDDDLYYLDGVALAAKSSVPQVTYDISIFRISTVEDFENKVFNLGDITFVEDKEFFGAVTGYGSYKERVTITEITYNFEEPDKDSFKVQNYKNAFDDLFQRITASVQTLKYTEGEYARAAGAVLPTGVFDQDVLIQSIQNNLGLSFNSTNNIVVQDLNGITVSSANDPARKIRINSMGIFISDTGGNTWRNTINSAGIFTGALTEGSIDIDRIPIYQGNHPLFRWDQKGINAYPYKIYNVQEKVYRVQVLSDFLASRDESSDEEFFTVRSSEYIMPFVNQIDDIKELIENTTYNSGTKKIQFGYLSNPSLYDSTKTYNKNDLCKHVDNNVEKIYICLQNNTTGTWDSDKWSDEVPVDIEPTIYDGLHTYVKGDLCKHIDSSDNIEKVYVCIADVTGGAWLDTDWSTPGIVKASNCYSINTTWERVLNDDANHTKQINFKLNNTTIFSIIYDSDDSTDILEPSTDYEVERVTYMINPNTFVRFDRFGLYGLNSNSDEQWDPESEEDVWSHAQFGLTWRGFFLKKRDKDNGNTVVLELSSDNDFVISEELTECSTYSMKFVISTFITNINGVSTTAHAGVPAYVSQKVVNDIFKSSETSGSKQIPFSYAPLYSTSSTYSIGDYCQNSVDDYVTPLWICVTNISTPETWTKSKWGLVTNNQVSQLKLDSKYQYRLTFNWEKVVNSGVRQINFKIGANIIFSIKEDELLDRASFVVVDEESYFVERIKIGKYHEILNNSEIERYGILIRDKANNLVLKSDDEGNLFLNGVIYARSGSIGGWNIGEYGELYASVEYDNPCGPASGILNSTERARSDIFISPGTMTVRTDIVDVGRTYTWIDNFVVYISNYITNPDNVTTPIERGYFSICRSDSTSSSKRQFRDSGTGLNAKYAKVLTTFISDLQTPNLNSASDQDIKKDIEKIKYIKYNNFYDELEPVTFKFKNDYNEQIRFGFIAQDVEKSLIDNDLNIDEYHLVSSIFDPHLKRDVKNLSYLDFIPLNTWQIQLLKKRITELEERISQLESK